MLKIWAYWQINEACCLAVEKTPYILQNFAVGTSVLHSTQYQYIQVLGGVAPMVWKTVLNTDIDASN